MAKAVKGEVKILSEQDAWDQLSDLFGSDSIVRPDEVIKTDIIRTGAPSLDRAIGVGGWPRGRMIQLAGAPSSGKTLMSLIAIANWQKQHPDNCAAFLDAEFTYSPEWAAKFGVDNDRVYLVKNNEAAKLFSGLVGKIKKNKATGVLTKISGLFDMIHAGQSITYVHPITKKKLTLNCGRMGIIVLDSMANVQVPQEMEADSGKALVAPVARFLTQELKKLTPGIAKSNVCFIGINQVRVEVGKMFGDPECVNPFSTTVRVKTNKLDGSFIIDDVNLNLLFESIVGFSGYSAPQTFDVSDAGLEIEGWDFESGSPKFSRINSLIIKESVSKHWQLGDLQATSGHLVYDKDVEAFVRMDQHKLAEEVDEPIYVVDMSVDNTKNYIANGQINHNTTPGGKALKHACSIMVEVGPMSGADNLILDGSEEKQGHKVRGKVSKNKLAAPLKVAEFFVDFRSGICRVEEELLDLGAKIGVFTRPNNRTYIVNGETLTSRDLATEYVKNNMTVVEDLVRDYYLNGGNAMTASELTASDAALDPFSGDDDEYEDVSIPAEVVEE